MQFQLQVGSYFRDLGAVPDDDLGQQIVALVRQAVPRHQAPTCAAIARPERLDVVSLKEVVAHKVPVGQFIASLTRAQMDGDVGHAHAVGLMGLVEVRPPGAQERVPMAVVFLEWPDCRWWHWRALVDPTTRALREDTVTLQRAIDGDPMPIGYGRWWSTGRRMQGQVRFNAWPGPPQPLDPIVH